MRERGRLPVALLVTVAATILGCVVTFPLVLHLGSAIYGTPGDSTGAIATFWWWSYAIQHGKPLLDNTMWGAPFGAGWSQVPFAVLPLQYESVPIPEAVLGQRRGQPLAGDIGELSHIDLERTSHLRAVGARNDGYRKRAGVRYSL